MSDTEIIAAGKVAGIHYVLTDGKGKVLDQSTEEHPMYYLHGHRNLVPGLEKQLAGKKVGDHVTAVVPPEEGYGRRQGKAQQMRRSEFPEDAVIEVGARFMVKTREDQTIPVWITKIMGNTVTIDHNHPLADQTLHFEVDVLFLREATEDELTHGHSHGKEGHGHSHGHGQEEENADQGADQDADEQSDHDAV
ncbi:MAG: peptidylprolyl isomerase [Deltaproteobacteria bacterium]|nr:MAG: peptidylprolyl isomerase [Deltaproteobacteria bacterium]